MSGTEWTEPGKGATTGELTDAIHRDINAGFGDDRERAFDRMDVIEGDHYAANPRTNLRLTGAPLTAEDVERISHAK